MNRRTFLEIVTNTLAASFFMQQTAQAAALSFAPYGRIVYQTRPEAPNQIYIVGQLHEHPITKDVTPDTIRTQIEIYRIGEKLVRERSLELVLLEGLFEDEPLDVQNENIRKIREVIQQRAGLLESVIGTSDEGLEQVLKIKKEGIPSAQAGYWLAIVYNLILQGADDRDLHRLSIEAAKEKVRARGAGLAGERAVKEVVDPLFDHLTHLRTAYSLHNIPLVIEREYTAKRISRKQALEVIGFDHIPECIEFVKRDCLKVSPPPGSKAPPLDVPLGYIQAGYGVTVIMPRTIDRLKR